ncbi:MAG: ribonuclease HI [Deltaproteobacteria bacterium]|jgi:ribonuclease HI|nr:ribonuclease HI [Deltaproteobacteria bacterium]
MPTSIDETVKIYSDGSCLGNPGPGGWAALLVYGERRMEISGGYGKTTNNRMELTAAIRGLEALKRQCRVELYTDSRYLCDAINKKWLDSWQARGWKKADKKDVLNRDLWEKLLPLLRTFAPRLIWVRGHNGHPENELVDSLARNEAAKSNLPPDTGFGLN